MSRRVTNGLIVLPMNGVRPSPPPTSTSKPISPAPLRCRRRPMSWILMAARSWSDAVTAGLDAVHADGSEVGHRVRKLRELDPVELDVLARREVAVAAVIFAGDMRQHAHLR